MASQKKGLVICTVAPDLPSLAAKAGRVRIKRPYGVQGTQ